MLPNKLKNTASEEIGNGDFLYVARHMHCLLVSEKSKYLHHILKSLTTLYKISKRRYIYGNQRIA